MIEKILERLEEIYDNHGSSAESYKAALIKYVKQFEKEVAKEYETSYLEQLVEASRNCSEDSDCSECPFGQIEDRCILAELCSDAPYQKGD